MKDTIKKLVEAYGPSGHEDEIRAIILQEIGELADEVRVDPLGNLIAPSEVPGTRIRDHG